MARHAIGDSSRLTPTLTRERPRISLDTERAMFKRFFRTRQAYRYSRWDGTQRLDDLDAKAILDALSDDYLKFGDLRQALERMMQQGFHDRNGDRHLGLQDLLRRTREERQRRMQRYNMSGVLDDIKEKLEHIKQLEREGIQRRLDQAGVDRQQQAGSQDATAQGPADAEGQQVPQDRAGEEGQQQGQGGQREQAGQRGQQRQVGSPSTRQGQQGQSGEAGQAGEPGESPAGQHSGAPEGMDPEALRRMLENIANKKLQFLDQLPTDPSGQIRQLSEYDFMDEQARQEFQELLASLQQQVMQQYFQGMQQ